MFFDVNKYSDEELKTFWKNFSNLTNHYTTNERWSEVVPKGDFYSDFSSLTLDNVIYEGHNNFCNEENEKTSAPFVYTSISVILAKKAVFDYKIDQVLPFYEFETYYQSTRLTSVFERTREFSELKDDYKKCEEILLTLFPEEETTLYYILTTPESTEKLSEKFNDEKFGYQLIKVFTNILAFDFVRNYLKLNNERRDPSQYTVNTVEEQVNGKAGYAFDYDECDEPYTVQGRYEAYTTQEAGQGYAAPDHACGKTTGDYDYEP